jgi:phospholipase/carboxylesterase
VNEPTFTRRRILEGLGGAAIAARLTTGSKRAPPGGPARLEWPRTTNHAGVEIIELFPNGADESSPLIVAIHGMGDRPDRWVDDWKQFPHKAQIALPRAFDRQGDGWSWFEFEDGMTDEQFGTAVGAAEARLWRGIAELAGKRRLIVTGFSQGGILAFAFASRHPDVVLRAFPIAASCPGPLLPKDKAKAAPLLAFHGTTDTVLDIKWGREAVHAFKEQGNEAELREYAGVGHRLTAEIHRDLWDAIGKTLPTG